MIYRVHRKANNPQLQLYGSLLGYFSLCNGYVSAEHIREKLLLAKLIPNDWIAANQLQIIPANTHFGLYAYNVSQLPTALKPRGKQLLYLYPVEPKNEQPNYSQLPTAKKGNEWYISSPFGTTASVDNMIWTGMTGMTGMTGNITGNTTQYYYSQQPHPYIQQSQHHVPAPPIDNIDPDDFNGDE